MVVSMDRPYPIPILYQINPVACLVYTKLYLTLFLSESFFPGFPTFKNNSRYTYQVCMYVCIKIRRRSVAIREILSPERRKKKKKHGCLLLYLPFSYILFGEKNKEIWGLWRGIESLACVNRGDGREVHIELMMLLLQWWMEIMGKRVSDNKKKERESAIDSLWCRAGGASGSSFIYTRGIYI